MSRLRRWLRGSGRRPAAETETALDLCAECGEGFVYPVSWTESGPAEWFLHLRCGACWASRDVVASNYAVEAFDRHLDSEMEMIEDAAARLAGLITAPAQAGVSVIRVGTRSRSRETTRATA